MSIKQMQIPLKRWMSQTAKTKVITGKYKWLFYTREGYFSNKDMVSDAFYEKGWKWQCWEKKRRDKTCIANKWKYLRW